MLCDYREFLAGPLKSVGKGIQRHDTNSYRLAMPACVFSEPKHWCIHGMKRAIS